MATLTSRQRKRMVKEAVATAQEAELSDTASIADVNAMSLEELASYLSSQGVELDLDVLRAEAARVLATDAVVLERGTDTSKWSDTRLAALEGRIQKAVEHVAKYVTKQTIRENRNAAFAAGDDRDASERLLTWVSVMDESTCGDCEERHGVTQTEDEWEGTGPGDLSTICQSNCRCVLVPVSNPANPKRGKS